MVLMSSTTSPMRVAALESSLTRSVVVRAWPTASPAIRADSCTCRLISVTDEAISSVAEATDCTLVEASSDAEATAVASCCERAAVAVVRHRHVLIAALAQPHPIRRQPLAVVIDDDRQHRGAAGERRDPLDVTDAVLQHGDAGFGRAQAREPWRRGLRLVRLGAQQHPVHRLLDLRRIGVRRQLRFNRSAGLVEHELVDRAANAGHYAVPTGRSKAAGGNAADTAEPDHGYGLRLLRRLRW